MTFCDVVGATAIEQAQRQLEARGCQLTLHGIDGPLRGSSPSRGCSAPCSRRRRLTGNNHPGPTDIITTLDADGLARPGYGARAGADSAAGRCQPDKAVA